MKIRRKGIWAFSLYVLCGAALCDFGMAAQLKSHAKVGSPAAVQTPAIGVSRQDLIDTESRMQMYAAQQAQIAADKAANSVAATAREAESRADSAIFYLTIVASIGIAVVGTGVGVLLWMAWQEGGRIRVAREQAEKLHQEAVQQLNSVSRQVQDIEAAKARIQATDQAVRRSIVETSDFFKGMAPVFRERLGIVGKLTRLLPPTAIARFEEADILVVIADNNNSVEKSALVEPFVILGHYWRLVLNLERAVARFQRAVELSPSDMGARHGLCGALYNLAASSERTALKNELLDQAQIQCDEAKKLNAHDPRVWFDQGWIFDERAEYEKAAEAYRRAQTLDFNNEWPNSTYNLACTLSKWGRLASALEELKKTLAEQENREDALTDPDLAALREHPEFGAELKTLCDQYAAQKAVEQI